MKTRRYNYGPIYAVNPGTIFDMSRLNLNPNTAAIHFDVLMWKGLMFKMGLDTLEGCMPNIQGDAQRPELDDSRRT